MLIDGREFTLIFCDLCGKMQPVSPHLLPTDIPTGVQTLDIECAFCRYVIATLREPPREPKA